MSRGEIFSYVREKYGVEPDYPWMKNPNYAILRHSANRKWFAAVFDITEDRLGIGGKRLIDALLLKCDPMLIDLLRGEEGILPAYHMNKRHWITVLLDGSCRRERVLSLIDSSYGLTK